jgi:hypothetical protein
LKHRYAICAALAFLLGSAVSQAEPIRFVQALTILPPGEVVGIVRSAGFLPIGRPALVGDNYVLRAVDRHGDDVQVIVDAEDAEILYVRRLRGVAPTDFAQSSRFPDFFGNVPRPPRVVPPARATTPKARAATGTPVPRPRPADVTGSASTEAAPSAPVSAAPAAQAAPAAAAAPAARPAPPAKTEVPAVVGFE